MQIVGFPMQWLILLKHKRVSAKTTKMMKDLVLFIELALAPAQPVFFFLTDIKISLYNTTFESNTLCELKCLYVNLLLRP